MDAGAPGPDAHVPVVDAASPPADARPPSPDAACVPGSAGTDVEVCNGVDDDCDGTIDLDAVGAPLAEHCYTGPEGTQDVGPCDPGTHVCVEGAYTACVGQVLPGEEICDGVDNDCTGLVDDVVGSDGCERCETGDQRDCYTGPDGTEGVGLCRAGRQSCGVLNGWLECIRETVPAEELCNGEDDDCDGRTDEGIPGLGGDCMLGVGACQTVGTVGCGPEGPTCLGFTLAPIEEVCNGVDDDCDGETDEGDLVADCPVVSHASPACARGGCEYTCDAGFFDADANTANGCERGCSPAPLGGVVRNLELPAGQGAYTTDLAVTVNDRGLPAVVYTNRSGDFGGMELVMHTDRDVGLGGDGLTYYKAPAVASSANTFLAFAGSDVLNLIDARWVGASVRPGVNGGWESSGTWWQRQTDAVPAAAVGPVANVRRALLATLDNAQDLNGQTGRLRLRVMNVATGETVSEPLIGQSADYSIVGARLAAASTPTGVVIAAQYRDQVLDHHLRVLFVDGDGLLQLSVELPGGWPLVASEVQVLQRGDQTLVGLIDRNARLLRLWPLSVPAHGGPFLGQPTTTPAAETAQLSLVATSEGTIAFLGEGVALRALFLDAEGTVVGQVPDAVVAPPAQRLDFARAASNGREITAAWVHSGGRGTPYTLRWSPLDCR